MTLRNLTNLQVDWDGTSLHFVDRDSGHRVAKVATLANSSTAITVTSTSAASLYTGSSSSLSATGGVTGYVLIGSDPPSY